jgi:hypothetical protein
LTVNVPPASRLIAGIVALAVVILVVLAGIRIGSALFQPDPAVSLAAAAPLQQIQTSSGVYLGKVVGADGTYVRLARPAALQQSQSGETGSQPQLVVVRLSAQPFDIDGDILIERDQIVVIGNVVADSGLEIAYRQAFGDLPPSSPAPATPAPSSPGEASPAAPTSAP